MVRRKKMATFGVNNNLSTNNSQETSSVKKDNLGQSAKDIVDTMNLIEDFNNGKTGGERLASIGKIIAAMA